MTRILVVDDVEVVRIVISRILSRAGYAVEGAGSGEAAIALINAHAPDAVVTDLWMPGVTGLSLMHTLQREFPAIVVLAMTGGSPLHDQEASLERARQAGASCVLLKPIDKNELVAAVAQAFEAAARKTGLTAAS